MLKIPAANR